MSATRDARCRFRDEGPAYPYVIIGEFAEITYMEQRGRDNDKVFCAASGQLPDEYLSRSNQLSGTRWSSLQVMPCQAGIRSTKEQHNANAYTRKKRFGSFGHWVGLYGDELLIRSSQG